MTPDEQLEADTMEVCETLFVGFPVTHHRHLNVRGMMRRISKTRALEAAKITLERFPYAVTPRLKYWAGVCWRMVREDQAS